MTVILSLLWVVSDHCVEAKEPSISMCFAKDHQAGNLMGFVWLIMNGMVAWGIYGMRRGWHQGAINQLTDLATTSLIINCSFISFLCMINPTGEINKLNVLFHLTGVAILFIIIPIILILLFIFTDLELGVFHGHVFSWLTIYHSTNTIINAGLFLHSYGDATSINKEFRAIYHSIISIMSFILLFNVNE